MAWFDKARMICTSLMTKNGVWIFNIIVQGLFLKDHVYSSKNTHGLVLLNRVPIIMTFGHGSVLTVRMCMLEFFFRASASSYYTQSMWNIFAFVADIYAIYGHVFCPSVNTNNCLTCVFNALRSMIEENLHIILFAGLKFYNKISSYSI